MRVPAPRISEVLARPALKLPRRGRWKGAGSAPQPRTFIWPASTSLHRSPEATQASSPLSCVQPLLDSSCAQAGVPLPRVRRQGREQAASRPHGNRSRAADGTGASLQGSSYALPLCRGRLLSWVQRSAWCRWWLASARLLSNDVRRISRPGECGCTS